MAVKLNSIIKKVCLLLVVANTVYLSGVYFFSEEKSIFLSKQELVEQNVFYDANNPQAEVATTNIDYAKEIEYLLEEVANDKKGHYWLTDTKLTHQELTVNPNYFVNESSDPNAWINKNTIFQDPRLTMSLYVNYIKNELVKKKLPANSGLKVDFDWSDWVDLTYLNEDLEKPTRRRKSCEWIKAFSEVPVAAVPRVVNCIENRELSPQQVNELGFDNHEQLPGYIQQDYAHQRATNGIRIAQGKSYLYTHMPNPFKLAFLNKDGGMYEVDVNPERKKIAKSGLMNEYVLNNSDEKDFAKLLKYLRDSLLNPTLTLNPGKEFAGLKNAVEPFKLSSVENLAEQDPTNMYSILHNPDVAANKSLPLDAELFHYSDDYINLQVAGYKKRGVQHPLSLNEKGYLESLELSLHYDTFTEPTYFKQSTLVLRDPKNRGRDQGYHYDWRFFNGGLNYQSRGWTSKELNTRTNIILDRLLRNWFRFTEEKGITNWIMHGPLLSWYWNGFMFPFDNDIDVQMPVQELVRLGELYNQTLVIEDLDEGYGKFLIDVGTYVHNRDISRHANHIDARFIDVDTGIYIDITGLSVSNAQVPLEFYESGLMDAEKDKNTEIYNDRRKHFYKLDQLSPLKYTMMGGVPLYIPNKISDRLTFEYPQGLSRPEFQNWFFVPKLGLWVRLDQLTLVLEENDSRLHLVNGRKIYDKNKIINLVVEMTDEEVYQLLKKDPAVLSEYYLTKEYTAFHDKELEYLFSKTRDPELNTWTVEDNPKMLTDPEFAKQYMQHINTHVKFGKPVRKPLFLYEKIEHPKHHDNSEPFSPEDVQKPSN